jgi:integrase
MQHGHIYRKGTNWMLQYWQPAIENGKVVKRRVARVLVSYSDRCRTESQVRSEMADELAKILTPINARRARPESNQTVATYLEHIYLPHCLQNKRPSTYKGYCDMWKLVEPHLNGLQMRNTRTSDIDRLMRAVADEKQRAHTTHRNVKSFLSGAFRYAKRNDLISDNPVRDSVVPRGKPMGDTAAYTLQEIQQMLAALPEPPRTVVLVAGLTGLRKSEIAALRWEDFRADQLDVRRSVWRGHLSDTKTLTSRAAVPVLPIVRKALEEHRKRVPAGNGFIFEGATGKPMRLENVLRREIKPALEKAGLKWLGWHAFRRGLGTNLNTLGADPKTIQTILRHANVSTTQAFYIKPVAAESVKAMKKLEKAFRKARTLK